MAWLAAQGVSPGDRVAILLPKEPAFVIVHLACLRRRAVSVPLNPRSSAREIGHIIDDSQPTLLVSCPELEGITESCGALSTVIIDPLHGPRLDGATDADSGPPPLPGDTDLACLLYTSGTTGRPKGAMLGQRALAANDAALRRAWEWTAGDRLLHVLPLFHVHGLFVALHGALGSGASCVLLPRFGGADTWEQLAQSRATVFMGVPTMYHRLLAGAPRPAPQLPAMRLFSCGSAPLRADTLNAFETLTGHRILERYGMTEVGMACSNPYRGERRAGTVGFDLPGVVTRLADPDDPTRTSDVDEGAVGEVMIRSDALFSGYWRQPEISARALRPATAPSAGCPGDWLASGDLGRRDKDGYLHLVGRAKELIISGGFNVYPQEVEACLSEHDGIGEAAVFGIPDDDLGERIVAAVVPLPGAAPRAESVIAHCKSQLAHYKCPRLVLLLDELPRNAMGKLRRGELPAACGLVG